MKSTNYLVIAFCTAFILLSLACGKKGDPIPQDHNYMFHFAETTSDIIDDCLMIMTRLEGAYENINGFILELEAATEGICLDCPFKVQETVEIKSISTDSGRFSFQYCPQILQSGAESCRFRLAARSIYSGIPNALTPVILAKRPF